MYIFDRKTLAMGVAVALCAMTTACGSSDKGASKSDVPKKFAFANTTREGALFVNLEKGIKDAASMAGLDLKAYNNDGDASTALSNARLMLLDKPDVILEYTPVADSGTRLGSMFKNASIPCVAVNIPIPGCAWFNQDNTVLAKQMADVIKPLMDKRGWSGKDTTVVLLQASALGPAVNNAVWNNYSALAKVVPDMQKAEVSDFTSQTTKVGDSGLQVDAGLSLDTAYTAMKRALQTIPKQRHIVLFAISDDQTLGAFKALKDAGRDDEAMLTGFGGDETAVDGLRNNPAWVAECSSFFTSWGPYLFALGTAVAQGEKAPELTQAPQAVLTKDNVDDYFDQGTYELKKLPPLVDSNKFLAKTGILQKTKLVEGLN